MKEDNQKQSFKEWMNDPELKALREIWNETEKRQNAEDDAWWDSLDCDGKSQAFRQMMKLMHKAEVKDRGSYRYAMYDVFGVDYCDGLAHYMDLHNAIYRGLEADRRAYRTDDEDVLGEDTIGP
jgi:hypothetical protein